MRRGFMKYSVVLTVLLFAGVFLYGCGSKDEIHIKITDRQYETELISEPGQTVEELLKEAEITLDKDDIVKPGLKEVVEKDQAAVRILRHASATVFADGKEYAVELSGGTVKDALSEAGVKLGGHDYADHATEAYVTDGMEIHVVHRSEVTLKVDGKSKKVISEAATVKELLAEQNIKLGKKDRISNKPAEKLTDGMKIVIYRVEAREEVKTEAIAYDTKTQSSGSMYVGTSKVTQEGVNGSKKITYRVNYVDGKEESRKVISEEVVKEPVSKIVMQGTKKKPAAGGSSGSNIVSKEKVYDCDGSGHGYYIITYKDGTVKYEDF